MEGMKISEAAINNDRSYGKYNSVNGLFAFVIFALVAAIALLSAGSAVFHPNSDIHLIGGSPKRSQIVHNATSTRNIPVPGRDHLDKLVPNTNSSTSKAVQTTQGPKNTSPPSSTPSPAVLSGKRKLTFWKPRTIQDMNKCLQSLQYKTVSKPGGLINFTPIATPGQNGASMNARIMLSERGKYEKWNKKGRFYRSVNAQQVNAWTSGSGGYPGFHPSNHGKTEEIVKSLNRMLQKKPPPDRPYKSCAIIGGGYRLKGRKLGAEIDSHEAVIRVNEHKVKGYEEDVGHKTTLRIMHFHVVYGHLAQYFRSIYFNETPTIPYSEYFLWGFNFNFWDATWKKTYAKTKGAKNMPAYFMGSYKDLNDPAYWPHKIDYRMMKAIDQGKWTFYKWKVPPNPPPISGVGMNAVDNTGEGVWYNAMGYCERISLYGFTSRGDETRYSYYW
jgi:hypothetical protein